MPPPIALSKTKLLSFLQCPRKLWLEQYSPELEDEDALDFAAMETGRVVGEKAREIYGRAGGHRISNERGLRAAITDTAALIEAGGGEPIFEASFDHDGLTVQVDVLDRSGPAPRIVEVKSATEVKPHYLNDCAIQAWTLQQEGITLDRVSVALIDNAFVYAGDGDYAGLFWEEDLTDAVRGLTAGIGDLVDAARATLAKLDEPEHAIGKHCTTPYACPFFEHCAPAQREYPVLGLGGRKAPLYELLLEGYGDIRDLPEDRLSGDQQHRIWTQTRAGKAYVGTELRTFVESLAWPRYFLDFETIGFAVPIWADTRPYQALPFQWSCHVAAADGALEHREFLDLSGDPPMRRCAERLLDALGTSGPILVYTAYEKQVLEGLAARFPDLAPALTVLVERLVDLHPVTKAHYYHPEQHGSWSIKAVLPTIGAGLDYSSLSEVSDGEAAQTAFLEAIDPSTPDERRRVLEAALRKYCEFDTLALVKLVEFFAYT